VSWKCEGSWRRTTARKAFAPVGGVVQINCRNNMILVGDPLQETVQSLGVFPAISDGKGCAASQRWRTN
jgi:hypothetical protein